MRRVLSLNIRTSHRGLIFQPGIAARPISLNIVYTLLCASRGSCNESLPSK